MFDKHPREFKAEDCEAGCNEEMSRLLAFKVYNRVKYEDWNGEVIGCRWVFDEGRGGVRARVVGQDFNDGEGEWLFAATPDGVLFRYFMSELASDDTKIAALIDAVSAFLQSPIKRKDVNDRTVVRPPVGVDDGYYWDLEQALPGIRSSSRSWQDRQADGYGKMQFERGVIEPCGYFKLQGDVKMETHGDDALIIGKPDEVKKTCAEYVKEFKTKDPVLIGLGPEYVQEGSFLKRRFGVTKKGWYFESDPKYTPRLKKLMNLDGERVNPAPTPGDRAVSIFDGSEEKLNVPEHAHYRSVGGTCQFQALDRLDVKFSAKEIMRDASSPDKGSMAKAKRHVRFLCGK